MGKGQASEHGPCIGLPREALREALRGGVPTPLGLSRVQLIWGIFVFEGPIHQTDHRMLLLRYPVGEGG